jgi:hypothetical protein
MNLDTLIERARAVMPAPYRSPKYELWKHDVQNYVEQNYGEDLLRILHNLLRPNQVMVRADNMEAVRNERINRVIEFLEELKGRDAEADLASSSGKTLEEAKQDVHERLSRLNITVAGNATFGDNSPLNQIEVGEFMISLISEVEAMPDSAEKHTLLQQLKAITENPTFASVAGAAVGSIIQGLVK